MFTKELHIGEIYLSYLINNDISTLEYYNDLGAKDLLDGFMKTLYNEFGSGHLDTVYDADGCIETVGLQKCDATGELMACAVLNYVYYGV